MRMNYSYTLLSGERRSISYIFRYKYYFLTPIAIATILYLLINIGVEITFQSHEIRFSWARLDDYKYIDLSDEHYFIKTDGCTIPAFNPFDQSVRTFYKIENQINCHNGSLPPLVESNLTSLWIVKKYYSNYDIVDDKQLICCFRPFYRQDSNVSVSDDRYEYDKNCTVFIKDVNINDEFVRVECLYKGNEIYKDFHAFITVKNHDDVKPKDNFNILVLGIDAVSRLNFYRTMPKTLQLLKDMDVVDFRGYNKVGDNTYPNLIPVLAGLTEAELDDTCLPNQKSTFDDCPFIWKRFKENGYTTGFAEDASPISLFNYLKNGFVETPTDYYWRTFNFAAEKEIGHEKHLNANLCVGSRMVIDILLNYAYKFVKVLSNNLYFGFFWETSLTHDFLNYPVFADDKYSTLIENLKKESLLNRTIIIILSDHGIRWGKIRSTHQGRMEERLPFLYIVLPELFKQRFPLASSNIKRNTKRLTTPFDLHETFLDLLDVTQLENQEIEIRTRNKTYEYSRGISLFLPINENRTCPMAGIDPHWCTCHQTRKLEVHDDTVITVSNYVLSYMNNLLNDYVQCAKLNISRIVEARIGEPSDSLEMKSVNHLVHDYTVVIDTEPGHGLFEATVRHSINGWNVTGTISRLNLYGKQSHCVDNFHIKLYCYCNNLINIFR